MIDFVTFKKLPKNWNIWAKLIVAKGFKCCPSCKNCPIWSHWLQVRSNNASCNLPWTTFQTRCRLTTKARATGTRNPRTCPELQRTMTKIRSTESFRRPFRQIRQRKIVQSLLRSFNRPTTTSSRPRSAPSTSCSASSAPSSATGASRWAFGRIFRYPIKRENNCWEIICQFY